ncbi:uncharacterized protein [Oscarella lobularis]|uniref:uncharacterized protein n=1 Tax=Oscarella lobularis TaxID=121494 RepID=UPI0033137011
MSEPVSKSGAFFLICALAQTPLVGSRSRSPVQDHQCSGEPPVFEIDALHENGDLVIGNNDVVLLRTSFKNISDCGITSASVYDSDTEDLLTWCNVTASAKNKCSVSCLMSVADYIQNKMKVYIGALEMSEKYKTRNWTVSCSTLKDGKTCSGCGPGRRDSDDGWKVILGGILGASAGIILIAAVIFYFVCLPHLRARLRVLEAILKIMEN